MTTTTKRRPLFDRLRDRFRHMNHSRRILHLEAEIRFMDNAMHNDGTEEIRGDESHYCRVCVKRKIIAGAGYLRYSVETQGRFEDRAQVT